MAQREVFRGLPLADPYSDIPPIETRRNVVFSLWEEVKDTYADVIPSEDIVVTEQRLIKAFDDFLAPPEVLAGGANSAFFVHSRRVANGDPELDDAGRCFPAFRKEYGVDDELVETIWNNLPPFEVGKIAGKLTDGTMVDCSIFSVQITPTQLMQANGRGEQARSARFRIEEAADLAKKFGAKVIGLGETLATLTYHGRWLQEKFPEIKIATGHAFTTYFIREWVRESAKQMHEELPNIDITIIGANGSIGGAVTDILAQEGVGGLTLHDVGNKNTIEALKKKAGDIVNQYPYLKGKIKTTIGSEHLEEACKSARIIVSAASAPKPFITAEHLLRGTIDVDDSQPPSILDEDARKAGCVVIWPVGKLPEGVERTFDYGLLGNAEWGCALEVIALQSTYGSDLETVGAVTPQRVDAVEKVAKKLGYELPIPQSFGKAVPLDMFHSSQV